MTLFEIVKQIASCVKLESGDGFVETETGEVLDVAALEQLEMDKNEKIRNIACWIKNLESDEKQLDEQEQLFKNRKLAKRRLKEQLKSYLSFVLNGQKWECPEAKISWRKSESVEITDIKKISKYYLRTKPAEPNKELIKQDLKAGQMVLGAMLSTKNNISVK